MDPQMALQIGRAFASHYYTTFDRNRSELASLYVPQSMLSFEGQNFGGPEGIIGKLVSLPFKSIQHIMTTCDAQPTMGEGVLIHVVGQLKTDDDPPHSYSETFHLKKAASSFVVLNQLFRLSLHHG